MEGFISTLLFLLLAASFYFLYRNDKVFDFQTDISNGCFGYLFKYLDQFHSDEELYDHLDEYYKIRSVCYEMLYRYSYPEQLFSFRPLKLNEWFSDEEIELLETGINYYRGTERYEDR